MSVHFTAVIVRWLGGSFAFFVWLCVVAKSKCATKRFVGIFKSYL